jgi:hypothetical protein
MGETLAGKSYQSLATWRHCVERIEAEWRNFLTAREDRLRHGGESEKVAETILEDLFTGVLDWSKGDLNYQIGFADIVLSRNLAKYLVIEVKRPGMLSSGRRTLHAALEQARRYADEQHVPRIAASDGRYLYAADIKGGGLDDRVFVDLADHTPRRALWWLSVHGIYQTCEDFSDSLPVLETEPGSGSDESALIAPLLHPKYQLPARCFAYVGNANDPSTWKLPYLLADGRADGKRLPKAIQALFSNYRGAKVGGIPEQVLPDVFRRLARVADAEGKLPPRAVNPAPAYQNLALVLEQLGITQGGQPPCSQR